MIRKIHVCIGEYFRVFPAFCILNCKNPLPQVLNVTLHQKCLIVHYDITKSTSSLKRPSTTFTRIKTDGTTDCTTTGYANAGRGWNNDRGRGGYYHGGHQPTGTLTAPFSSYQNHGGCVPAAALRGPIAPPPPYGNPFNQPAGTLTAPFTLYQNQGGHQPAGAFSEQFPSQLLSQTAERDECLRVFWEVDSFPLRPRLSLEVEEAISRARCAFPFGLCEMSRESQISFKPFLEYVTKEFAPQWARAACALLLVQSIPDCVAYVYGCLDG